MTAIFRLIAAAAVALAGCAEAGTPRSIDQPGLTSEGSGGSGGPSRGRVGLRVPFPLP